MAKWNGSAWVCADDIDTNSGGDITAVSAGTGLTGGGISGDVTLSISSSYRLPQSCSDGQVPKWISSSWVCADDNTGGDYWSLTGNAGTDPRTNFLGTTDNQAFEIRVNNARALRIEPNQTPNIIGGYKGNSASAGVIGATIGGGGNSSYPNRVRANYGTVGGGLGNSALSSYTTVGGGYQNVAGNLYATVSGGNQNEASGFYATVGGGYLNSASNISSTVGGGRQNIADGQGATVGGGYFNLAHSNYATVPGGSYNAAKGDYSFAAGRRAVANNQGCFVWGDATDAVVACNTNNRTIFRSSGGFFIYTSSDLSTGAFLRSGSGSWENLSDRNLKENIKPVDPKEVLQKVVSLPISTWNYKAQDPSIRHMGPMAQDFYAAFGLGADDRHITTIDADGVALAAIQGLYKLLKEKDKLITSQKREIQNLRAQVQRQQARLKEQQTEISQLKRHLEIIEAALKASRAFSMNERW